MRLLPGRSRAVLAFLAAVCLLASGCRTRENAGVRVLVDGEAWNGQAVSSGNDEDFRVYITLDGKALLDLPFGEARTVQVLQPDGGENTVEITGDSVYMAHADCENQDCVDMGAVTRENLEMRVMGGFIVCLPHKLSVEVRGK